MTIRPATRPLDRARRAPRRLSGALIAALALLAGCADVVVGNPTLPTSGLPAPAAPGSAGAAPSTSLGSGGSAGDGSGTAPVRPFPMTSPAHGPGTGQGSSGGDAQPGTGGQPGDPDDGGRAGGSGQGGQVGEPGTEPGAGNGEGHGDAGGQAQPAPSTAPSWVKPGLRFTYYLISTQTSGDASVKVEDPNGDWVDQATGKHYRIVTVEGDGTGGASGDGYVVYDVRAIVDGSMAVTTSQLGIDHLSGYLVPGGSTSSVATGPNLDSVWMHPDVLAAALSSPPAGTSVLTGNYQLDGVAYQAITLETDSANSYQLTIYDQATGILLTASSKNVATTQGTGGGNPTGANTQLGTYVFKGVRQRQIPGLGGTSPSWVAQTPQLSYAGTYHFVNPMDPGSAAMDFGVTQQVMLQPALGQWYQYTSDVVVQMPTPVRSNASGLAGPDGHYWFDPAALAGLTQGTVVDQDPVTTEKLVVAAVDASTVTFQDTLPGLDLVTVYDKSSGVLLQSQQTNAGAGTTITVQRQ